LSVSIPRRVHVRFPGDPNLPRRLSQLVMSQSPERSTSDFQTRPALPGGRTAPPRLNPPKGPRSISTSSSTMRKTGGGNPSQSPEGSTFDFHIQLPARGRVALHAVSIPRRVHVRFPRGAGRRPLPGSAPGLNPPKGPRSISTFHDMGVAIREGLVSIPRRVHVRFPRRSGTMMAVPSSSVSIPRRVHVRFPPGYTAGSTTEEARRVSIPRRVHVRFPLERPVRLPWTYTVLSQSPEGSTFDFHGQ